MWPRRTVAATLDIQMEFNAMEAAQVNRLKSRLAANQASYVFAVRSVWHPGIVGIAKASGYDGLYIDFQHSPISLEAAAGIFQAAGFAGLTALARLPSLDLSLIGRAMDAGAHGLMLADVRNAAQAKDFVAAALLAPAGERSFGMPIDTRFASTNGTPSTSAINNATLLIAMLETVEGIERVGEIAATPGIDAVQIGSADLTASLGLPGEFGHPKVQAAYQQVAAACQANHKPFIIAGIRKTEDLLPYVAMGAARCYFTGSDSGFLLEGAHAGKARAMAADDSVQRRPHERS
jgi:4-hydroxy-2-oxoheptanedioate aldolase